MNLAPFGSWPGGKAFSMNTNTDWEDLKKVVIHEAGLNLRTSDVILRILTRLHGYTILLKLNMSTLFPIGFRP
jgi:predicted DCC family thiol-disulfide oxidoreductase YuxK